MENKNETVVFVAGNRIPYTNEVISSILDYSVTIKSEKQKRAIISVVNSIYKLWLSVFDEYYLIHKSNARDRLKTILRKYEFEVVKYGATRSIRKNFFKKFDELFDLLKPNIEITNESIANFYEDQKSSRRLIVEDVELSTPEKCVLEANECEVIYDNPPCSVVVEELNDYESDIEHFVDHTNEDTEYTPFNQSGLKRRRDSDQTAEMEFLKIPIRKGKFFQNKITECLALGCVDGGITINQSRKTFVSFSKNFYKQMYLLEALEEDDEFQPPRKRPYSNAEYEARYKNVIPSYKSVACTMHNLAIATEYNVALQLLEKGPDTKASLHYDTTSRKNVKGELTSMILELSNGKTFKLRPFTLAKETQDTIADFFVAEIRRIAIAAGVDDPSRIWELVDSLMTDAAAKNLGIETVIAQKLGN
jgi:hypothetical protein